MSFYLHAEVVSVAHQRMERAPNVRLVQPVTLVIEYVHECDDDSYYYRAEIVELTQHKIYYPGIGATADEAIANIFDALLKMDALYVQTQYGVTSPRALSVLRQRRAVIERYIALPAAPSDELHSLLDGE